MLQETEHSLISDQTLDTQPGVIYFIMARLAEKAQEFYGVDDLEPEPFKKNKDYCSNLSKAIFSIINFKIYARLNDTSQMNLCATVATTLFEGWNNQKNKSSLPGNNAFFQIENLKRILRAPKNLINALPHKHPDILLPLPALPWCFDTKKLWVAGKLNTISHILDLFYLKYFENPTQSGIYLADMVDPGNPVKISNFTIIQDHLCNAIFLTLNYEQYSKLTDSDRLTIKTKIADTLFTAHKSHKYKPTILAKDLGLVRTIEFDIGFFTLGNLQTILKDTLSGIALDQYQQAQPTTGTHMTNFFKSALGIDNSPKAISRRLNQTLPIQDQKIFSESVTELKTLGDSLFHKLALLYRSSQEPSSSGNTTHNSSLKFPNEELDDFLSLIDEILKWHMKGFIYDTTLVHNFTKVISESDFPQKKQPQIDNTYFNLDAAYIAFIKTPTVSNIEKLKAATLEFLWKPQLNSQKKYDSPQI